MKNLSNVNKRLYFAALRASKEIIHKFSSRVENPGILFIAGCQRSGTTLMYEIFQKDFGAAVYPEFSRLSDPSDPEKLRLLPLEKVRNIFSDSKTKLIISKPLVESQNLNKLLTYFKGSKAVWMYRDYKSVAKSNIKHFGKHNGLHDLTPMINRDPNNWRSERLSDEVFREIKKFYSPDMDAYDAAALFWYARNSLYFEQELQKNRNVILLSYEELVSKPEKIIRELYHFIDQKFPGERIIRDIHSEAVSRGKSISLNPEIELLCNTLYSKLKEEQNKQYELGDFGKPDSVFHDAGQIG